MMIEKSTEEDDDEFGKNRLKTKFGVERLAGNSAKRNVSRESVNKLPKDSFKWIKLEKN